MPVNVVTLVVPLKLTTGVGSAMALATVVMAAVSLGVNVTTKLPGLLVISSLGSNKLTAPLANKKAGAGSSKNSMSATVTATSQYFT